jgi:hypothetical protein
LVLVGFEREDETAGWFALAIHIPPWFVRPVGGRVIAQTLLDGEAEPLAFAFEISRVIRTTGFPERDPNPSEMVKDDVKSLGDTWGERFRHNHGGQIGHAVRRGSLVRVEVGFIHRLPQRGGQRVQRFFIGREGQRLADPVRRRFGEQLLSGDLGEAALR